MNFHTCCCGCCQISPRFPIRNANTIAFLLGKTNFCLVFFSLLFCLVASSFYFQTTTLRPAQAIREKLARVIFILKTCSTLSVPSFSFLSHANYLPIFLNLNLQFTFANQSHSINSCNFFSFRSSFDSSSVYETKAQPNEAKRISRRKIM